MSDSTINRAHSQHSNSLDEAIIRQFSGLPDELKRKVLEIAVLAAKESKSIAHGATFMLFNNNETVYQGDSLLKALQEYSELQKGVNDAILFCVYDTGFTSILGCNDWGEVA